MKMKWILKSITAASLLMGSISLSSCTNSNSLKLKLHNSVDIFINGPRKLDVGTTYQYTAEVRSNSNDNEVLWSLSNPGAGHITEDGQFTPSAIGTFSIIATLNSDPSICSTFQVKVNAPAPESITISGPDQVVVGTTASYTAAVEPSFADPNVTWKSSAPGIASIGTTGDLQTYGTGDVTISAISTADHKIQGTKAVKIIDAKPESITIVGPTELNANETRTYDVSLKPEKAYKKIRWSFDNPEIATIDESTGEVKTSDKTGTGVLTAEALFIEDGQEIVAAKATLELSVGLYHDVTMAHTIGTGFTLVSHRITHGQTHKLRFVSSTYKIGDKDFPTHKYLKKSDLEVVYDGDDIINDCSLSNNELTIPAKYCDRDIKINVLGGEISDIISWSVLSSISDNDAFTSIELREAKKCFQVGDYKNVTHNGSVINWARLIDFDHDSYLAMNPSSQIKEEVKTDFSFEFQKPICYTRWCSRETSQYTVQYYEHNCDARSYALNDFDCDSLFQRDEDSGLIVMAFNRECLIEMPVHGSVADDPEMKTYPNYFWPMSLWEAMGDQPPSGSRDPFYAGPEGERYAYYEDKKKDDEGYKSLKSFTERLTGKKIDTSRVTKNWYFLRTTGVHEGGMGFTEGNIYWVDNEDGSREWDWSDGATSAFCPVFGI